MTTDPNTAALARVRQMADHWEQHLPDVIRTAAVVSALRAALGIAEPAHAGLGVSATPSHTDRDVRRERYAAALLGPDAAGALDSAADEMLDAVMAVADAEQAELRRLADEAQQQEPDRSALMRAHTALAAQAGHDQAALRRVRTVLETEAVVGRSALEYRGLITAALMADAAPQSEPSVHGESVAHLAGDHDDEPAVDAQAAVDGWRGATELVPDHEVRRLAATGVVGYQQDQGRLLHCLHHKPVPASRWADFHEVTSDDLPDGGFCVHPRCGADLLAVQPVADARQDGAQPS